MPNQFMLISNQYSILAITTGIVLVLLTVISYLAFWLPRLDKRHWVTQSSPWKDVFSSVPWVLIVIYTATTFMAVIVLVYYSIYPPNW